MKNLLITASVATLLATSSLSVQAADVEGDVKTKVNVGAVLQSNKGIANKNEANIGSITGKNTDIGGDVKTTVNVGAVLQSNKGIANKNEVNIGSVTD